ncbi:hypothetical protein ERUR111494_00740 [Erysipelothrix urinaevulpis]|uniref:hypothetical protein n=1 Tax=Erysipelothrix urinaevulpis TaxID=2683717 RepID=UPI00135ADD43|nr:hypothetical protein [Erysipelothrix urinaevulpis]
MKSRVKKYSNLHQEIASDAESSVENSDLSHFANRLNDIDDQFERVQTSTQTMSDIPSRARKNVEQDFEKEQKADELVDTFENHYLKDFLAEVKEYNVKKGYRDVSDTQANILSDLQEQLDRPYKKRNLQEEKQVYQERPQKLNQEVYDGEELGQLARELMNDHTKEEKVLASQIEDEPVEKPLDDFQDDTLVFGQQVLQDEPQESLDDETIAMAVLGMANQDERDQALSEEATDETVEENLDEVHVEESDVDLKEQNYPKIDHQNFLEQTQTLQHKVIDLEKDLDKMSNTTARTNQLLHVVLSLLLFAIIVVALLLVAQLPQFRR